MCKHAEKENGLQDLMEIMLESMRVAERGEFLRVQEALHSVYDRAVYPEPLGTQPTDTFHIVGDRLVRDVLAPQHAAPRRFPGPIAP